MSGANVLGKRRLLGADRFEPGRAGEITDRSNEYGGKTCHVLGDLVNGREQLVGRGNIRKKNLRDPFEVPGIVLYAFVKPAVGRQEIVPDNKRVGRQIIEQEANGSPNQCRNHSIPS